jgi:hypothetical protein
VPAFDWAKSGWNVTCPARVVPNGWKGHEQRRATRVDVLRRVHGRLLSIDQAVVVHDLSRTGFSVVSQLAFAPGETLDFQLVTDDGSRVHVAAESVHTRPVPDSNTLHFSGFRFVPGRLTGSVPYALVDKLIEAVSPVPSIF